MEKLPQWATKENEKKNAKPSKKEEKKVEPSNAENGDADSGAKKV